MATERTDGNGEGGMEMTERYTGPSAKRIADLFAHRVSSDRGWFWTTTAICYCGRSDGLAFRQRPDAEGTDVRCHTRRLLGRRGDNAPGDCHRAAHLDGLRACERHRAQGPREAAVVEAQAGSRGRGGRPDHSGAADNRRRGALRPERRRPGHRRAAAQPVPRAAHGSEVPPLTASGRSQPIPTRKGRLQPGTALLLCPQAGAIQRQHNTEGGRDDNGNIGNWQSDDDGCSA